MNFLRAAFYTTMIGAVTALPFYTVKLYAQPLENPSIKIGKPVPSITFNRVLYGKQKQFSTSSIKKPTVLYFFSSMCSGSFRHLPQINELYTSHREGFDLILVGIDIGDSIRSIYEAYRTKYKLSIPATFDTTVYKKYRINAVPHVIWIDQNRIVRAVTNVLDEAYVKCFTTGKQFEFIDYSYDGKAKRRPFDPENFFFITETCKLRANLLQASFLTEWSIGMPHYMSYASPPDEPLDDLTYLQVLGRELADLYRIAYFGRTYAWDISDTEAYGNYHYSPILEISDKSQFQSNHALGRNLFCYGQILPATRRNPEEMMKVLQTDLKNSFGYEVSVETREMPYLSLVATTKAKSKLKNRGEPSKYAASLMGVDYTNISITNLISLLSYNLGLVQKDLPLLDETGIQGNINISFNAIMTDLDDVKRALNETGLDIVRKRKEMEVIVIREPAQ